MFVPIHELSNDLNIAILVPNLTASEHATLLYPQTFQATDFAQFDAVFVGGLDCSNTKELTDYCASYGTPLIKITHPSNDTSVIQNVILNIVAKLYSHEMPSNIDLADIINLNNEADTLCCFDSFQAALTFLNTVNNAVVSNGLYLASTHLDLETFTKHSQQLSAYIADSGYLCASLFSSRNAKSSVLIGLKVK